MLIGCVRKSKNLLVLDGEIKITDEQGNTNILEITSTDIEWSMKQYQRPRKPFTWEIQEEKDNL